MTGHTLLLILHVLGATIWTGGHIVLAATVLPRALRTGDCRIISDFEAGYERLGVPALFVQIATGIALASQRLPFSSWFSFESRLATLVFLKLALLVATLALALHARFSLVAKLRKENLRALALHIVAVTILAVLFVVVGVVIGTG